MVEGEKNGLLDRLRRLGQVVGRVIDQVPSQAEIAEASRIVSSEQIPPEEIEAYRKKLIADAGTIQGFSLRTASSPNNLDLQVLSLAKACMDGLREATPEAIQRRMRLDASATLNRARAHNLIP